MSQDLSQHQSPTSLRRTQQGSFKLPSLDVAWSQPAAVPSLSAAPNRARRLQDWANRELQALLDQQDVSIVRSFVVSLANTHGLDRLQAHAPNRNAAARTEDAIRALQPFLHDRTEHFWHELK